MVEIVLLESALLPGRTPGGPPAIRTPPSMDCRLLALDISEAWVRLPFGMTRSGEVVDSGAIAAMDGYDIGARSAKCSHGDVNGLR